MFVQLNFLVGRMKEEVKVASCGWPMGERVVARNTREWLVRQCVLY